MPPPPPTLAGTASVAALGSDVVSVSGGVGAFSDKNAGSNKAVTVTGYTLSGADAGNYNLIQPSGLTATINKADLNVNGISASSKTYDASTNATLSGTASVAALGSDVVSVTGTGTGTFADKNAGINKAVSVSGYTLTGSDAGNYNFIQPSGRRLAYGGNRSCPVIDLAYQGSRRSLPALPAVESNSSLQTGRLLLHCFGGTVPEQR